MASKFLSWLQILFTAKTVIFISDPASGDELGNTKISVIGHNFIDTHLLRCQVGSLVQKPTFVDSGLIYCVSPPYSGSSLPILVSNNNQNFEGAGQLSWKYHQKVTCSHFSPTIGSIRGANFLEVFGTNGSFSLQIYQKRRFRISRFGF